MNAVEGKKNQITPLEKYKMIYPVYQCSDISFLHSPSVITDARKDEPEALQNSIENVIINIVYVKSVGSV